MTQTTGQTGSTEMQALVSKLIEAAPERLKPLAAKYGPTLAAWTAEELWAWIMMLTRGDWKTAQRTLLKRMDTAGLIDEFGSISRDLATANIANKETIAAQRRIGIGVLEHIGSLALTLAAF